MSSFPVSYSDILIKVYGFTIPQLKVLIILPKITGTMSTIGSSYIIYDVAKSLTKRENPFNRIMLGMSIADLFSSFFVYFLSSWPIPKGYNIYAAGNIRTCDAQGFLGHIGLISNPLYNCSLATFLLLIFKFGWSDERIKAMEKWFHIVPWISGIVYSSIALALKTFVPVVQFCGIGREYPLTCSDLNDVECVRGGRGHYEGFFISIIVIVFSSIVYVIAVVFAAYRAVLKREKQMDKYTTYKASVSEVKKKRKYSKKIMTQGIFYSVTLVVVWIFLAMAMSFVIAGKGLYFVTFFLVGIFAPLQGFFNMLIYIQGQMREKKSVKKTKTAKILGKSAPERGDDEIHVSFRNTNIDSGEHLEEEKIEIEKEPGNIIIERNNVN
mmetsp:Transcript_31206/g.35881  ORF Transcript_31206/g.35881 Transcript_31206/m.35881 type:complete len:382 (+) Transcript_31206:252-1397(+)